MIVLIRKQKKQKKCVIKITNLLGKLDKDEIPKFTTIKWIEIFDQSNGTYNPNKDK